MNKTVPSKNGFFKKNSYVYLIFLFIFIGTLIIRLSFVGLIPLWREDGYHYLAKAEEIIQGDFSLKEQDIGLSLFYSPFFLFFGSGDLFEDLHLAQVLLAVVESLILIPIFLIAMRFFRWKGAILASLLFAFWPGLVYWTAQGYSEGLFVLLLLFSFYFLIMSDQKRYFLLIAAVFTGLAFYVRVNGIFFFPLILLFSFIYRKEIPRWNWKWLFYVVLAFLLVISPYFMLRFSSYQSPFHYSMSSRYLFSDSHQQLYDPDFHPTISSFLSTHSMKDILSRGWRGIKGIIQDTHKANYFLMTLAFIGLLLFTRKKFLSFHFVFLFWFLGLFWIYAVVRSARFLTPLVPFAIILAAGVVSHIFEKRRKAGVFMGIFLVFFIFLYGQKFSNLRTGLKYEGSVWESAKGWGTWIAQNIPPGETLAMREGIDIADMIASQIKVETIPHRDDIEEIWAFLREKRINYLAIGSGGLEVSDWNRIPALKQIRRESLAPFLVRIYSDESLKWPMAIFRINWDKKDAVYKRGPGDVVEVESLAVSGASKYDPKASNGYALLAKKSASEQSSILLGPLRAVPPGKYRVSFRLKAKDVDRGNFFVRLNILFLKTKEILARKTIRGGVFKDGDVYKDFDCVLDLEKKRSLHFKIVSKGHGELWVDSISFFQAD